jgi:hypothetical protein
LARPESSRLQAARERDQRLALRPTEQLQVELDRQRPRDVLISDGAYWPWSLSTGRVPLALVLDRIEVAEDVTGEGLVQIKGELRKGCAGSPILLQEY